MAFITVLLQLFSSHADLSVRRYLAIFHEKSHKVNESASQHGERISQTYESLVTTVAAIEHETPLMANFFKDYPSAWQVVAENINTARRYLSLYINPFIDHGRPIDV